jgi:hypothetical protein
MTATDVELAEPRVVELPLRGEWLAINSPGDRVPSHGTDMLGQRFAYDFIRVDRRKGWHVHPAGALRSNLVGFPVRECYGWGQPIHMPFDGEILEAVDGIGERSRIVPIREIVIALKNGMTFRPDRLDRIMGNHVIARSGSVYAGFAHLAPGSVAVRAGEAVRTGQFIGRVGPTGKSTAPHLHFQLMDGPDPLTARGLPCAFRSYEVEQEDGRWTEVRDGIPKRAHRIRHGADASHGDR